MDAYACGQRLFGESHAQELKQKHECMPKDIEWHFIGHLQTNKVNKVVGQVDLIQSVDSYRLLEAIAKEASRQNICQDILLEINVAGEESKTGFAPEELEAMTDKSYWRFPTYSDLLFY